MPDGFEVLVAPVRSIFNHRRNEKFTAGPRRPGQAPGAAGDRLQQDARTGCLLRRRRLFRGKGPDLAQPAVPPVGPLPPLRRLRTGSVRPGLEDRDPDDLRAAAAARRTHGTQAERFHLPPPGISQDRRAPANAADVRAEFRREFGLEEDDLLLVQIGSGFKTKGLDRSLALAALPKALRRRTRLIAIGQDDPKPFLQIAPRSQRPGTDPQGSQRYPALPARRRPADPPGLQREHRYGAAGGAGLRPAGVGDRCLRLCPLHRRGRRRAGAESVRAGQSQPPARGNAGGRSARAAWSRNGLAYADHAASIAPPT